MSLFPEIYPTVWEPTPDRFEERDSAPGGFIQINAYDPVVQIAAHASWETLTRANYDLIEDHWYANTDAFYLFNFHFRKLRDIFIAIADGVALTYTLPAKGVVGQSIKHNNVVAGSQPTLSVGSGANGEDQIVYTGGTKPANGVVLTFNATDARQRLELNYGTTKFLGRHREADVWKIEADFVQKVVA